MTRMDDVVGRSGDPLMISTGGIFTVVQYTNCALRCRALTELAISRSRVRLSAAALSGAALGGLFIFLYTCLCHQAVLSNKL